MTGIQSASLGVRSIRPPVRVDKAQAVLKRQREADDKSLQNILQQSMISLQLEEEVVLLRK
jgi:hypothetical protein